MRNNNIAVVIPYEAAHTPEWMLERAVNSVKKQTHMAEPIVVRGGPSPAWGRNRGMEKTNSRYIAFLDADDYWAPTKLEKQYKAITRENTALCLNIAEKSDGSKNNIVASSAREFATKVFCGDLGTITSSMLVDTKLTDAKFDESLYRREDHLFALEVVYDGGYCYIEEPLTYVEKHEEGLSADVEYDRKIDSYQQFYERAIDLFPELDQYSDEYWAQTWYNTGRGYYYRNDFQSSLSYLWRSFVTKPEFKTIAALGISSIWHIIFKIRQAVSR